MLIINDACWDPYCRTSSRYTIENNSPCANLCTFMNNNVPKKHSISTDRDAILDGWHPPISSAYGDMLVKLNILPDNRVLGNHASQAIVLKHATLPYLRMTTDMTGKEKLSKMSN